MNITPLPVYQSEIMRYCKRVEDAFDPASIILHGSIARGNYTPFSDVDLVVIGDRLPENFLKRLDELNRLRDGKTPFEVVGYTMKEWESMMNHQHLTALEAIHWGIPLIGEELFAKWRALLNEWKAKGLRRGKMGWAVPQTL